MLPSLYYIWCWWQDMSGWREQGFGLGPISHCEILAWSTLYQIHVTPSEVAALKSIDILFRNYESEKAERERKANVGDKQRSVGDDGDAASLENAKKVVAEFKARKKKEAAAKNG